MLLAACAAPGPQPGAGDPGEGPGHDSREAPPAATSDGVVDRLLVRARRAEQVGDLSGAEAALERAVRIAPRDAKLWYYMARLRMAQKAYPQAASMAAKSNSLAHGNRSLQHDNWHLISQALTLQGDAEGAAAASARAAALKD